MMVDFENDYGDPKRGVNQIGQYGVRDSFIELGHTVYYFAYDKYLNVSMKPQLQVDLLAAVIREKPDLIFLSLFRDQFEFSTLEKLKQMTRTVSWFGDDTWRFESFSKRYAPYFTDIITTDPFAVDKYHANGFHSVHLSQWAAMDVPGMSMPEKIDYRFDVSFVGGANPSRRWMISLLEKQGVKVECFGFGWNNGVVSTLEMMRIFQTSKISLNLSNSISHDWRYLLSGPRALKEYLRSGKNSSQIKARNFEVPYWGGFQLSDYVPFIDTYFALGREMVCYGQFEEIPELVRYYLAHDDVRESIRLAGFNRARAEHGYKHRLKNYLATITP